MFNTFVQYNGLESRKVGPFKIVSPNLNINIYSINEKTLRKIILCGWHIVRSQEKFLHE